MSTRKQILKNSAWGNLNILVRYGLSFVATAIIASHYGPADFGVYQLAITYVGILDAILLLHPTHIRNHLISNPGDESKVISAWVLHNAILWLLIVFGLGLCWLFSNRQSFYLLLFLSSLRLFFRIYEYPQILIDARVRSDVVQKIQIVSTGSFNIIRGIFGSMHVSLNGLASASFFQGLLATIYQRQKAKDLSISLVGRYESGFCLSLIKQSFPLALMGFLGVLQARIVGVLFAEKMGLEDYGSYQLIFKLIEPVTAVATIVFSANYTTLAHTYRSSREIFVKRFLKISILTIISGVVFSLALLLTPKLWLLKVFGDAYKNGIDNLWMGPFIVASTVLFTLSIQFDILTYRYKQTGIKYVLVIIGYFGAVQVLDRASIMDGLVVYSLVPLLIGSVWVPIYFFDSKKDL